MRPMVSRIGGGACGTRDRRLTGLVGRTAVAMLIATASLLPSTASEELGQAQYEHLRNRGEL